MEHPENGGAKGGREQERKQSIVRNFNGLSQEDRDRVILLIFQLIQKQDDESLPDSRRSTDPA